MSSKLRVGIGQPYGISITVLRSDDFDPELPTGATFYATKPDADSTVLEWTGLVLAQSSVSARAVYWLNADGGDLDIPGTWRVWVQWTVVGQTPGPRSEVHSFNVIAKDQK